MTLREAITAADALINNEFTDEEKICFISELDGLVFRNIIEPHEGGQAHFVPYDATTPPETELLIGDPYATAYVLWIQSKADYFYGEAERYNNSAARFLDAYNAFSADYNQRHRSKKKRLKFW